MRANLVNVLAAIVTASTPAEYNRAKRRAGSLPPTEQYEVVDSLIDARRRIFADKPVRRCTCVACQLAKADRANGAANGKPALRVVG